uniref:polynucleotide adenylyltransferase n=1 Tax=Globodera rostochiensis TaxID=31243 RepID=A0A914HY74_GLORO
MNINLATIFCVIFIFSTFIEHSRGGKGKKVAKQNAAKSDQSDGISDIATIDKNRQCPEKGDLAKNSETDPDSVQFVADFKEFLSLNASGSLSADFTNTFRINSLIWHFTQKIGDLLNADVSKFNGNSVNEFAAKMTNFRMKWEEIKGFQKAEDFAFVICILYQFASILIRETISFAKQMPEWNKCIRESRLNDLITTNEVSCERSEAEIIYSDLMSSEKISIIYGQNLANLLELSQNFRHYFCHDVKDMGQMKLELNKLIDPEEMNILENNFPEIMRIDLTLTPTLFIRCETLLINRSSSEQYRETLMNWTVGQLIGEMIATAELCQKKVHKLNLSASTLEALAGRIRLLYKSAYRNLQSEEHLCALIKLQQFVNSISSKNIYKINEKLVKRWQGLEECAMADERQRTVAQFRQSDTHADMFEQSLQKVFRYMPDRFRITLRLPGSKTRLAKLMGTRKRFEKLIGDEGLLKNVFTRDLFVDDSRLWAHYKLTFQEEKYNDALWLKCCKIGTDLIVFMRWVKRKLDKIDRPALWDKMRDFVEDELYDPMFDKDEEEMDKFEKILAEIFARTKIFISNFGEKNVKMFFKKWKETVVDEALKGQETDKNAKEHLEWVEKMHQKEFKALLDNEFMADFGQMIVLSQNNKTIKKNMQIFFTEKTIGVLCKEIMAGPFFVGESSKMAAGEVEEGAETTGDEHQQQQRKLTENTTEIEKHLKQMLWKGAKASGDSQNNNSNSLTNLTQNHFACPSTEEDFQEEQSPLYGSLKEMGQSLLTTYLAFLSDTSRMDVYSIGGKGLNVLVIELQGVLWWLLSLCERLMAIASALAVAPTALVDVRAEASVLSQQWNELLEVVDGLSLAEQKVFFLHKFARFLCRNKTMWDNSVEWTERLSNDPMLNILFEENETELSDDKWTVPKYEKTENVQIFVSLTADGNSQIINFFCISEMIERFKAFRWFFCNMNETQLESSKMKLGILVGEEELVTLEDLYPEVLQIDVPTPLVQSILYKAHFRVPSNSYSMRTGARLILPLLLRRARECCNAMPKLVDRNISEAFNDKFRPVQLTAFLALRKGTEKPLLAAVCLLQKFTKYMQKSVDLYRLDGGAIRAKAIRNWTDEKCESDAEEQRRAYQQQIVDLNNYLCEDLNKIIQRNVGGFYKFMRNTRGARSRAAKFLTGKYKNLLEELRSELTDPQVFDDLHLKRDYLKAIFGVDTIGQVVGNLSAQISVWVRWMDSELSEKQNSHRTIGLKKVDEHVWSKTRPDFEDMYDELADRNLYELEQQGYLLWELFPRSKEFLDEKRTERNWDKLGIRPSMDRGGRKQTAMDREHCLMAEWAQMMGEVRRKGAEMRLPEEETEQERWMKRRHWHTLITLFADGNFRQRLISGFDRDEEAKTRLLNFIQFEMRDNFMELLNVTDEKEFETKVKMLKKKMDSGGDVKTEEETTGKTKAMLADQNMKKLIREEEKLKELKKKIAERQLEKRKRRRENEQKRKIERERRREAKNSDEAVETAPRTTPFPAETSAGQYNSEDEYAESPSRYGDSPSRYGESPAQSPSRYGDSPSRYGDSPVQSPSRYGDSPSRYGDSPVQSPSRYGGSFVQSPSRFGCGESPSRDFGSLSSRRYGSAIKIAANPTKLKKKKLEKDLQNELANLELSDFASDEFLHSKYFHFLTNPSETKRRLLDLGVFANEIWHRMEIVSNFIKILECKATEIGKSFEYHRMKQLEQYLLKEFQQNEHFLTHIKTEGDFDESAAILHNLLKRTIFELEGGENSDEFDEKTNIGWTTEEMKMVRKQLHRNKLAKALNSDQKHLSERNAKSFWQTLEENGQSNLLMKLFVTSKPNLANRFKEHLEGWRALLAQQRIDAKLHEQFVGKFEANLGTNFPENMQQIYFLNSEDAKLEQSLIALLSEHGFAESNSAVFALKALKTIISEWSVGHAQLLETGSYLLGAHTSNADIDTICIMRQRFVTQTEEMNAFFGTYYCDLSLQLEQRICEDNSLYCKLCKHPNVDFLNKSPRAYMPLIELKFMGIEFDVSFVLISDIESLPDEPLDATDVEWIMELLALSPEPREAMLKSLSGFLANQRILELMRNKSNQRKFRQLLWSIKFWAKSNYVYGNIFGFFNGASLSILTAKVILWYPNSSIPFLFEKLMFILTNWKWPMPVKLIEQNAKNNFESLSWSPSAEESAALIMPIITSSKLAQNASQNINKSTFRIIQNAMREAFAQLRILRNSPINSSADEQNFWKNLFPVKEFTKKYDHLVMISCMVSAPQHINQFCRFVERKLRFKLEDFDRTLAESIEYSHVNPNSHFANESKKCPKMAQNINLQFSLCKQWLVGLKMKESNVEGGLKLNEEIIQLLKEEVRKVDEKIFKEYSLNVLRGRYQHIGLKSQYIEASKLPEWW